MKMTEENIPETGGARAKALRQNKPMHLRGRIKAE